MSAYTFKPRNDINSFRQKTFTNSLGGAMAPLAPPGYATVVCQNKGRVHVVNVERQDGNAYELLNGVTTVNNVKPEKAESPSKPLKFAEMCIDGKRIKFQVDSGASVNLIPACHIGEAELSRPTKVLQMWDKSLKTPLGECRVKMINPANNKKYAVLFTVVDEDLMPVLGASASQQMGLITVNRANIRQVTATNREADILEKYKDVLNDDVGHFPGKAHLEVDATVKPVITPARKIPFALRPRLKDELDQLTEKGVIAPVNEPTEHVHALQYMAMTDSRLEAIRVATEADEVMTALKQIILKGWPDERIHAPPLVQIYFAFRDELAIHDGIVFRGERVVVPASQRSVLKEKIHSSHLGIDGCLRRAKECLFWPNMTSEIREYISTCSICRTYEKAYQRETLMSHDIPDRPWAKVGTDLFAKDGRDYLITVDYYSNFWEVDLLPSTESTMVINKLKNHFARYGIPDTIVSDGGPQYVSHEFAKFCKSWDIIHVTSSPYNSKAN